ncbi:AraC family transcriptional regulator [Pseudomonas japonica]|uniref:Transcriptional regulator, AraC family n=1 Tax=Pseudomonas japonica TaxID=256466 RepID=A0A239KNG9_9PSED|nr:helix-turn-helix transcriptional regulator [Pseudomonas japonica]SNT19711.1 transcriptional regulator, AraC family [Pseudomonas japonica]
MSSNGHNPLHLDDLPSLPRPLYGQRASLPNIALDYRHRHPWGQLSHALHGVLQVHTDNARLVVPPHRAVWIAPRLMHRVQCTPGACIRSLYLDPALQLWPTADLRVIAVDPLLRELIRAFGELPVEYDRDSADGRLVEVLVDRLRVADELDLVLPQPRDARLRALCRKAQARPHEPLGLGDASRKAGVSEKTLSRLFLKETGMTYRTWRQRMRLASALPALERGERVTDVALACGYDSLSAFSAAFRRLFGLSPGELGRGGSVPHA